MKPRKPAFEQSNTVGKREDNLPVEKAETSGRKLKQPSPFTKNLNALLLEKGISQRRAAEIAGLGVSTINGWTAGANPANFMALKKLTDFLKADLSFILSGSPSKPFGREHPPTPLSLEDRPHLSGIFQVRSSA